MSKLLLLTVGLGAMLFAPSAFAADSKLELTIYGDGRTLVDDVRDVTYDSCLLYTSPSPRDRTRSRMPSSA